MARTPRRLVLAGSSSCLILLALLLAARGQQPQAPNPERGFAFGDSNLDGKLSRDEFRDLVTGAARLKKAAAKKAPAQPALVFDRLDGDHDGFLSFPEFRRLSELRARAAAAGAFGKVGLARKKLAAEAARATRPAPADRDGDGDGKKRSERPVTPQEARFFETRIRPVLMTQCAECHASTAKKVKGGLLVDSREALRKGGDTGPAIVPGNLEASLLITAIGYHDDSLRMPPKSKLPDAVIVDFEQWVKMGAPDPRGALGSSDGPTNTDLEKARQFWAFQRPRPVAPPSVMNTEWPKTDIDRFILAALEAKRLKPVADADRHALIRRVSFDLVGLPPTPEAVRSFVADKSDDAFARVVDGLLASPRFGERWGRHWLDLARYAESSGKANMLYPNAWRYRDWVIAAFNADKPFDQFVKEQIAGDLLPAGDDHQRAEQTIATGFLAIGSKTHNMQNRAQFLVDLADEQIDVASQAFLGLTIACARCHDHKFDPISQRDYYALSGIFQSTQTCYGTLPGLIQNANPSPLIELPATSKEPSATPRLAPARLKEIENQLAELIKTRDGLSPNDMIAPRAIQTRNRIAVLKFRLASYRPDGTPRIYAMGVRERHEPIDSPFYLRGELDQPGEAVPRGLISVLGSRAPATITRGSGRLELAERLAARDNPLTARVFVNRIWLHLFGQALVPTPDNFGSAGQAPSHPQLLDTLAVSFMDHNWSIKQMIRQIVLSRAYQLGSSHDPQCFEVDPDNRLVWRMSPRRLEAEPLRDAVLAISGQLDLDPPVGSAVAAAGEGLAGPFRGFNQDARDRHRAVYLPVVRDQVPESLTLFDFADPSLVTGDRGITSGPAQALYLMNSPFIIRQAEAAAERLQTLDGDDDARIEAAYSRFLARMPTDRERGRGREFLARFAPAGAADTSAAISDRQKKAAWTAFCQALYGSAEFRYLD